MQSIIFILMINDFVFLSPSIWRHHENIDAARGGSDCFQRWKLHFIDKLGIMNKYFIEHLFKHNDFYIFQ